MRAVLDTNVIVSAHLSPQGTAGRILRHWRASAFETVVSPDMLDEFGDALRRPHLVALHHLGDASIDAFLEEFDNASVYVIPHESLSAVPGDADDNMVLECAVAGEADVIVNGDRKHLLPLGSHEGVPIVSPADFLAMLDHA